MSQQDASGDAPSSPKPAVDLTADRAYLVGCGIIFCCWCAPRSWSAERVSDEVSREDPPGTSENRWVVAEPNDERTDDFKGVNHLPCPDHPDRVHWLLKC